ncbi:Scr1 family TA system antitoxin-like transcriptional regulator [Nocardia takedensis]|uniref:Scr1 family TA system antitoxin-like transcriptional regulator n=1 Tax=Nocardia takedensis TaxID=259390 RepID=UPI003F75D2DB
MAEIVTTSEGFAPLAEQKCTRYRRVVRDEQQISDRARTGKKGLRCQVGVERGVLVTWHSVGMEAAEDWTRLGEWVVARREELGMSTRQAMAETGSLSYRVLGDLERGARPVSDRTLSQLERALGWSAGSARTILHGGEPTLAEPPKLDTLHASWMHALGEAYQVTAELIESGQTLQAQRLTQALNAVGRSLTSYAAAAHFVRRREMPGGPTTVPPGVSGNPTVLRIALGRYLKQTREHQGFTVGWVSETLGCSAEDIRLLERGSKTFPEHALRQLLNIYGVSDPAEQSECLRISGESGRSGWWMRFDDVVPTWFRKYVQLEQRADTIRTFEAHYVPGLLQTAEYARAVMSRSLSDSALTQKLQLRMERQRILNSGEFRLWAVIDAGVLLHGPTASGLMRRQLDHLVTMSMRPNITIQILPLWCPVRSPVPSFSILRFRDRGIPDVVYIEHLKSALYMDRPEDLEPHYELINALCVEAVSPDGSTRHLMGLRNNIDKNGRFEESRLGGEFTRVTQVYRAERLELDA